MKFIAYLFLLCVTGQAAEHSHAHKKDCGHAKESYKGKTIYAHDGHDDVMVDGKAMKMEKSNIVKNHDHKHKSDCGHESVKHDDHKDYLHKKEGKQHKHHAHGDHYHEDHDA